MTTTEIKLTGATEYNTKFPPKNAKKGYVAKITGRAAGAVKYAREFLGSEFVALVGDEGLYERQIGDKKGGATRYYAVVLSHPEHGLIVSTDCEGEAPKIAKLLDSGVDIHDAVEVAQLRQSERFPGRMIFDAVARTAAQADKSARSATIDSVVEQCLSVLRLLPEQDQETAMTAIKNSLKTPAAS